MKRDPSVSLDALGKHLELVQGVVNRMGSNSFLIKGWSITLIAGLLALAVERSSSALACLALAPVMSFWGLDAYYLRRERLFRALYRDLCASRARADESAPPFSLETGKYQNEVPGWANTLYAPTVLALHGSLVALGVLAAIALRLVN